MHVSNVNGLKEVLQSFRIDRKPRKGLDFAKTTCNIINKLLMYHIFKKSNHIKSYHEILKVTLFE